MESLFSITIVEDWQYRIFCLGKGLVRFSKKTWLCCGSFDNSWLQICFDRTLDIASSTKKAIWCLYMLFNLSFLLSNHFSFQGQSAENFSAVWESYFNCTLFSPLESWLFILEKWVVWRWKSFLFHNLFWLYVRTFLLNISYTLLQLFCYFHILGKCWKGKFDFIVHQIK